MHDPNIGNAGQAGAFPAPFDKLLHLRGISRNSNSNGAVVHIDGMYVDAKILGSATGVNPEPDPLNRPFDADCCPCVSIVILVHRHLPSVSLPEWV